MKRILLFLFGLLLAVSLFTACHSHQYSEATCTYPSVCSCGDDLGDALGHSFGEATCTDAPTCDRCGAEEGLPLGHSFGEATCTQAPVCSRCGVSEGKALGHSFATAAGCDQEQLCSRCGAGNGVIPGHNYAEATCDTPKTCRVCGTTDGFALGHKYDAGSCTAAPICSRCKAEGDAPLGHDFADATCLLPKTCSRCNATEGEALGHHFADGKCTRCNEIDPATIPVPLENLHVINESNHETVSTFTDSYGNKYGRAHTWNNGYYGTGFSVHNLNKEYTSFSGSLAVPNGFRGQGTLNIYLDDTVIYSAENIYVESARIDFSVDVTGGTKLKIAFSCSSHSYQHLAIANAQLMR